MPSPTAYSHPRDGASSGDAQRPKLLVVDVGNTQTHFGVFAPASDVVEQHWRFATVRESTSDELGAALANLLALRGIALRRHRPLDRLLDGPAAVGPVDAMAERYLGHEMLVVGPSIRTGMPIRIDNPPRSAPTGSSTRSRPTSASRDTA